MQHNLIFSNVYRHKNGDNVVHLESIRILSDVKLNFKRKSTAVKIYDVKVSNELLDGFIRRYYSIDVEAYRLAGIAKGRERRQALVVYLSIIRHTLLSKGLKETTIPINVMADKIGIYAKTPFHKKEALINCLTYLKEKIHFPFSFSCVSHTGKKKYYISLSFNSDAGLETQTVREHVFYFELINELRSYFEFKMKSADSDAFQSWLNSPVEKELKKFLLKATYKKIYGLLMSDDEAMDILENGFYPNKQ